MSRKKYTYIIPDIPPSNNKYLGKGSKGSWAKYHRDKEQWAYLVLAAVGQDKPKSPIKKAKVTYSYYFPTRHRRDPDNYSGKFLGDGLVAAGVLEDDSFWHIELQLRAGIDRDNPRTEIQVIEKEAL